MNFAVLFTKLIYQNHNCYWRFDFLKNKLFVSDFVKDILMFPYLPLFL